MILEILESKLLNVSYRYMVSNAYNGNVVVRNRLLVELEWSDVHVKPWTHE